MVEAPHGPRLQAWAACFVFSCVSLAAFASNLAGKKTKSEKWVLSVLSISLILTFLAVVAHSVAKDKFVGQKPEGAVSTLLLIFWCAGLPAIMDPNKGFAVTGTFGAPLVINSNLYFFSWVSFICVLYIQGHWSQEITGRDVASQVTPKYAKWGGIMATSVVVLAASAKIHKDTKCTGFNKGSEFCKRTSYAISLGVLGMVIAMGAIFLMQRAKLAQKVEAALAFVMFVLYTFGVGFITFGEGPAISIGNLYFATWIGFGISIFLVFATFKDFMAARNNDSENTTDDEKVPAPAPTSDEVEQPVATEGIEVDDDKA
jgi:hypothetical protein